MTSTAGAGSAQVIQPWDRNGCSNGTFGSRRRGKLEAVRCDNGPEYIGAVTLAWAAKRGIPIDLIQSGQPQQNGYVERCDRTVRDDWLAYHLFATLDEIQEPATGCGPTIATGPTSHSAASRKKPLTNQRLIGILVEAEGIEPSSASTLQTVLHT